MSQPEQTDDPPTIVIVGGGYSGAMVAWHLHRAAPYKHRIIIIEPRDEIGRGLAYDNADLAHRINVPALKMNLDFDDEGHFEQWLLASGYPERDPAAQIPGALFPTRAAFGDYVNAHIRQIGRAITHVRSKARAIIPEDGGYRVSCVNGDEVRADTVVLAIAHAPPQTPSSLTSLLNHPGVIANPWEHHVLSGIAPEARVLIVGTGLTMADIVASLDRQGHRGKITAVSRRGLRPQAHATRQMEPFGDFANDPERTTVALLRRIRRAIAKARHEGLTWHPVLDQVRLQGSDIWRSLPLRQRAKLIRHLRPFWDTYRFRIAPQVDNVILRRMTEGTLVIRAGSLRAGATQTNGIAVDLRARRGHEWQRENFDAVVIATGPGHSSAFETNPLLTQLNCSGLASPDPLGLGIHVDLQSRPIGRDGMAVTSLFVAGPLARGTFGELMGAPDLARHARHIAEIINTETYDALVKSGVEVSQTRVAKS